MSEQLPYLQYIFLVQNENEDEIRVTIGAYVQFDMAKSRLREHVCRRVFSGRLPEDETFYIQKIKASCDIPDAKDSYEDIDIAEETLSLSFGDSGEIEKDDIFGDLRIEK